MCGPGATSGGIISRRQLEYNQKQCRKRALQRWSTLVTADTSRISKLMRAQLGEHWACFVRYANKRYKPQFVEAFMPASNVLRCSGPSPGVPCPEAYTVDLNSAESLDKLPGMHLDHDCDLKRVCDRWSLVESIPTHVNVRGRSQTHHFQRVPGGAHLLEPTK